MGHYVRFLPQLQQADADAGAGMGWDGMGFESAQPAGSILLSQLALFRLGKGAALLKQWRKKLLRPWILLPHPYTPCV